MCGIAGWTSLTTPPEAPPSAACLAMLERLAHRGPDGSSYWQDERTWLGHRRLSIIDLSSAGTQPMANETGEIRTVFNGEIYNYRELAAELKASGHYFSSSTDTEVLLHGYEQWGMDGLLHRLRGMFAFALYDQRAADGAPQLFLARDRLGIKPLYYQLVAGRLVFASECQSLIRAGLANREVDPQALAGFLLFGSVPEPRTIWKSLCCLPPGHYLSAGRGGLKEIRYWELSASRPQVDLEPLLADTVDRHLIADVPVGIFLSGGVDSAGLACLAARKHPAIRTLTIGFEESGFNEAVEAREFAGAFGTDHRETVVTRRDFEEELPRILRSMDQPTADGINTYFVSRAARQAGLTVVLSGLGGDEVFWGYSHYPRLQNDHAARLFRQLPAVMRRLIAGSLQTYGTLRGQERWQRFQHYSSLPPDEALYLVARGFFPPAATARLLDMDLRQVRMIAAETMAHLRCPASDESCNLRRLNRLELHRYLHDQLLRDSDVFSMAHSIELRVPYLDHQLLEAVWHRLPAEMLSSTMNKPLLVEAIGHPLIQQAGRRPKRGFTFPFATWLQGQSRMAQELALNRTPLNSREVSSCWRKFRAGRLHWSRAWATTVTAGLLQGV